MSTIRIFDVETTGIDPTDHRVVEISAYDLLPAGAIERVASWVINPGRKIPPEASAVHHLMDADVADAPLFGVAWQASFEGDAPAIYAAHNCAFEQAFLPTPSGTEWICTYKAALRIWPDAPGHSNQVLRYWLGLDDRRGFDRDLARYAHRAEPDAYVTAWLVAELLLHASAPELIAWSKEPKVYPAITFGKHRGQKWADVPGDYLVWLRDGQHSMEVDWRHGAKIELLRRGSRA